MLTGKRYKLRAETLGLIELPSGKRRAVMIPADSIVRVLSGPLVPEDRMLDVVYDGKTYTMFVVDVRDRGEETKDTSV